MRASVGSSSKKERDDERRRTNHELAEPAEKKHRSRPFRRVDDDHKIGEDHVEDGSVVGFARFRGFSGSGSGRKKERETRRSQRTEDQKSRKGKGERGLTTERGT